MEAQLTEGIIEGSQEKDDAELQNTVTNLLLDLQGYTNLILWTFIPFIALFTYLINLKNQFNYAEHLVFQTYLFCISNILCFLFPMDHMVPNWIPFSIITVAMIFYYVYAYRSFLGKSWIRSILEMILILFFSSALWSVILGILFGTLIAYNMP